MGLNEPIEGKSLRSLCNLIETACEQLRDWLSLAKSELGQADHRRPAIDASVKQVRKSAEALLEYLDEGDGDSQGNTLAAAVARILRTSVQELADLCREHKIVLPAPRVAAGWGADLLRLTCGAQPRHEAGPAFADERRDQRTRSSSA